MGAMIQAQMNCQKIEGHLEESLVSISVHVQA